MIKNKEISELYSCFNKAKDNELIFVLLERDRASPATVRFWCLERILIQKNNYDDEQIQEALTWAQSVDNQAVNSLMELEDLLLN